MDVALSFCIQKKEHTYLCAFNFQNAEEQQDLWQPKTSLPRRRPQAGLAEEATGRQHRPSAGAGSQPARPWHREAAASGAGHLPNESIHAQKTARADI